MQADGKEAFYEEPKGGSGSGGAGGPDMSGAQANVKLTACPGCNRKFNEEAFAKHQKICNKSGQPTRAFMGPDGV